MVGQAIRTACTLSSKIGSPGSTVKPESEVQAMSAWSIGRLVVSESGVGFFLSTVGKTKRLRPGVYEVRDIMEMVTVEAVGPSAAKIDLNKRLGEQEPTLFMTMKEVADIEAAKPPAAEEWPKAYRKKDSDPK